MAPGDVEATLRKVAALRSLCLRLPHLPTPEEEAQLARFDALAVTPHLVTDADADRKALAAGWRRWWRNGQVKALLEMTHTVPEALLEQDRSLQTLRMAAYLGHWQHLQETVWSCTTCAGRARVAIDVRQQTDPPSRPRTRLLVVSLAPPFKKAVGRTQADSATNNPDDVLRRFLEGALRRRWDELLHSGVALLHAMKCAVVPDSQGFQNPPPEAVDLCAPRHLAQEILVLRPNVVTTLGRMAYRAVVRALAEAPGFPHDPEIRLTKPPGAAQAGGNGYTVRLGSGGSLRLFVGPFIRGGGQGPAKRIVRSAAIAAGVSRPELLDSGPAQTG